MAGRQLFQLHAYTDTCTCMYIHVVCTVHVHVHRHVHRHVPASHCECVRVQCTCNHRDYTMNTTSFKLLSLTAALYNAVHALLTVPVLQIHT